MPLALVVPEPMIDREAQASSSPVYGSTVNLMMASRRR